MTIRVEMHGEYPSYVEKCFGTTAEILAHVPTVRMAEGFSTNGGGQGTWVAGNGTWVGFTNAPGSPSSPFASEAQRTAWATANLATLRSGVSMVWGPGNVEYVWNGPLATDWEGIRGPYPGSPASPFATTAERDAAGSGILSAWISELATGSGAFLTEKIGGVWGVRRGDALVDLLNPCERVVPGVTTPLDFALVTLPVGVWNGSQTMRYKFSVETAANTGNDTFTLLQNGVTLLSVPVPPSQNYPVDMLFQRVDENIFRRMIVFPGGISTTNAGAFAVDLSAPQPIVMRLTPATGGNTIRVTRFAITRD